MMSRGNILLSVESIIPPEDIDGFRRPGLPGVYPVDVDEHGRKGERRNDIFVAFLNSEDLKSSVYFFIPGNEVKTS